MATAFEFVLQEARKEKEKVRLALQGPPGSGKTRSALEVAKYLVPGGSIMGVCTEGRSMRKYSTFVPFRVVEIEKDFDPEKVTALIGLAASQNIDVLIFDSLTHFWNGQGGFLELVDAEVARMRARGGKPDSFAAWKIVDPVYRRMVRSLLTAPMHIIACLRAKTEYAKEDGGNGKSKVRKIGLAPEIRDSFQYEFDIEGMMSAEHELIIGKTRCDPLDGKIFPKPGKEFADLLRAWLDEGAPVAPKVAKVDELIAKLQTLTRRPEMEEARKWPDECQDPADRNAVILAWNARNIVLKEAAAAKLAKAKPPPQETPTPATDAVEGVAV